MSAEESLDILVHPLVVLNICDHLTRDKVQFGKSRAVGLLFGHQNGREVQVFDTMDVVIKEEKDSVSLEQAAFEDDLKLFKETFPSYECLGWYSTGSQITPGDHTIHQLMLKYNERPLYLMLDDGAVSEDVSDLPIALYEQRIHVSANKSLREFVRLSYHLESDEEERIVAVHCAKIVTNDAQGQSPVSSHLSSVVKALGSLNQRIETLHTFLNDVQAGKVTAEQSILREIKGLCSRLPAMEGPDFKQHFMQELNEGLLVSYLSAVTQGSSLVVDVVEKFNTVHGRQAGGHGMGGGGGGGGGAGVGGNFDGYGGQRSHAPHHMRTRGHQGRTRPLFQA